MAPGHLNAYRFIGPPEGYVDATEDFPHDGLVSAPIGFYRIAEDTETGNKLLLFSYDADKLEGRENDDGERRLADNEGVSVIAARPDIRDMRWVEAEMTTHQHTLQSWRLHHLNLYVENETMKPRDGEADASRDGAAERRVVKMSNSDVGYGLFEQDDGTWTVHLYVSDKKAEAAREAGGFVEVGDDPTFDDDFFSLQTRLGAAETLEDASKMVQEDFYQRAHRVWKGESALPSSEDWRVAFKKKAINFIKSKTKKDRLLKLAMPLAAGVLVGLGGFAIGGGLLVGGISAAVSGIAATLGGVMVEHLAEETLSGVLGKVMGEKTQEDLNKKLPVHKRKMEYMYTDELGEMLNPEVGADKITKLKPLKDREANIRPALTAPTLFLSDSYAEEWVFGSLSGAFGAIVYPVNENSYSIQYPNGIVTLYDTEDKSVHVRLRDDLKIDGGEEARPPRLPEQVADLLDSGEIMKILLSHNGFDSSARTYAEFSREIREIAGMHARPCTFEHPHRRTRDPSVRKTMKSYPLQSIQSMFCAASAKPEKEQQQPAAEKKKRRIPDMFRRNRMSGAGSRFT